MARKKKVTDAATDRIKIDDFRNLTWVMNNLNESEISKMDSLPFDGERFADFMESCIDNGLDLKVTFDTYSKSYAVSAMGAWQGFHNANHAVSARGLDVFDAWKILWFKISVIAEWDLVAFAEKADTMRKRG